jgi:hypothetical protein
MTKRMIDPPSGWKYGFPKELPNEVGDLTLWLIANGYPKSEVDRFNGRVPYRIFEIPGETEKAYQNGEI